MPSHRETVGMSRNEIRAELRPEPHRPFSPRSISRFSRDVSIGQSAISLSVRLQPRHQPVSGSIRQMLLQGDGGCLIAAQHGPNRCRLASAPRRPPDRPLRP